jgi:hypothetical protein
MGRADSTIDPKQTIPINTTTTTMTLPLIIIPTYLSPQTMHSLFTPKLFNFTPNYQPTPLNSETPKLDKRPAISTRHNNKRDGHVTQVFISRAEN